MKIIFIRHGEANPFKGTLTLKGKFQIKLAKHYLKEEKVNEIFVSPQTRALQSAEILNKQFNAPVHIYKEFDERKVLKTSQMAENQEEYNENYLNYAFESDKYETCKLYIDRVLAGIKKAISKIKKDETMLIVAHSSTLYALNTYINGIPKDKQIKWLQCNNGAVIKFFI